MNTGNNTNDKLSEEKGNLGGDNVHPLYVTYPVNSTMELILAPNREVVQGLIYTTDEISNCIVLKKSLKHTTLASEIRICNAASVLERIIIHSSAGSVQKEDDAKLLKTSNALKMKEDDATEGQRGNTESIVYNAYAEIIPLTVVSKKTLDEREKRAFRLAEESFAHINQKASPEGQAVFDRLLKACNEVVWRGESIFVLNQIRVDPPYSKDDCKLLSGPGDSLNEGSLERVKKIVASSPIA